MCTFYKYRHMPTILEKKVQAVKERGCFSGPSDNSSKYFTQYLTG